MPQEVEDNNSSLSIDCNENLVHEDSTSPPIKGEMDMLHDENFYKGNVYENKFDFDNEDEVNLVEDDFFSNLMKKPSNQNQDDSEEQNTFEPSAARSFEPSVT